MDNIDMPVEDHLSAARQLLADEQTKRLKRAQERINAVLADERVRLSAEPLLVRGREGWTIEAQVRLIATE